MGNTLDGDFAGMNDGDRKEISVNDVGPFKVHYQSEQAYGDNGLPARGYTTGHFHVESPGGHVVSFRHTPHGPSLEGAKGYAAREAAEHILGHVRNANGGMLRRAPQGREVHPISGRQGM